MHESTDPGDLVGQIGAVIGRYHDAMPQGQGECGDVFAAKETAKEMARLLYNNRETIVAALRQSTASPPPLSGDEVERVAKVHAFARRSRHDCARDADHYWQNLDQETQAAELTATRAAIAALSPPPAGEVGEMVERAESELRTFERCSKATCQAMLATIESLQAQLASVNAECERRVEAHSIAFDQAMANGEEAARLREQLASVTEREAGLREALEKIEALKWPHIIGEHTYSTFGQATGREYKHKLPISREASVVLREAQEIARSALSSGRTEG